MFTLRKFSFIAVVALIAMLAVVGVGTLARYDGPSFASATYGSPVASPSAVPNSPTAEPTIDPTLIPEETNTPVIVDNTPTPTPNATEEPIVDQIDTLPNTGAGTNVRDVLALNHCCGWHFIGYTCMYGDRYAIYAYAYHYNTTYPQHLYYDHRFYFVSPWC